MRTALFRSAPPLFWILATSQTIAWEIVNPGAPINTEYHEAFSAITPDGLTLFISSDRPGGYGSSEKDTFYLGANYDIYVTHREALDAPWDPVVNLGPNINTSASEHSAMLSPDGHYLYFMSERPGGYGSQDIYRSYRADVTDDQGWEEPVNLGEGVNGPYVESCPVLYTSEEMGTHLFFIQISGDEASPPNFMVSELDESSNTFLASRTVDISTPAADAHLDPWHGLIWGMGWEGGAGASDLWQTARLAEAGDLSSSWSVPVNLGANINTEYEEIMPSATADGSRLYFQSDRPGGHGGMDVLVAIKEAGD